jgi:hypothetical protein
MLDRVLRFRRAALAAPLLVACCGSPKKPTEADISAYLAKASAGTLHFSSLSSRIDAPSPTETAALPANSWRVTVQYAGKAQADLYRLSDDAAMRRTAFDQAVSATEAFRAKRIEAVENFASKLGLMKAGAVSPEPALPAVLATKQGQSVSGAVTLLAEPDGPAWRFVPEGALPSVRYGETLAQLQADYPTYPVVMAGSAEDQAYSRREKSFLDALSKVPKPQ